MGFVTADLIGPYGAIGITPTLIGLGALYLVSGSGRIAVEISGLVRNTNPTGAGVNLSGRYFQGASAPLAGETVDIGTGFPITQHFYTTDPLGYYGFKCCYYSIFPTGQTWWFDLAIASTDGANAYVRDVQLTLIEY